MIEINWPAPKNVKLISTTRDDIKGVSPSPYHSLNLGTHVGDDLRCVTENRQRLKITGQLPCDPIYLNQTHSTHVLNLSSLNLPFSLKLPPPSYDAAYSDEKNKICCVMTADCLPVAFCNTDGTKVGVAHAGWRGLLEGILEKTIQHFSCPSEQIIAWLGPAIGPHAFEVGNEVRQLFIDKQSQRSDQFSEQTRNAFIEHPNDPNKYFADIYQLARIRLHQLGITAIYGGDRCTYTEKEQFFSYRREGVTGRQATLIWHE